MELSEQEMELCLPFPVIGSKNFFNKSIPICSNNSKMVFRNRKWNYLNRKWKYFSPFQSFDQKTSLTKVYPFGPTMLKYFSETIILPFPVIGSKKKLTKVFPFGPTIPKWLSETGNGNI
jgi:hypothetical protein